MVSSGMMLVSGVMIQERWVGALVLMNEWCSGGRLSLLVRLWRGGGEQDLQWWEWEGLLLGSGICMMMVSIEAAIVE